MAQDDRINVRDHKIKFEFSFLERMRTHTIGNTLCAHKNLGCYQSRQNMIHKTLCVLKILKVSKLPGLSVITYSSNLRNPVSFPDNRQDEGLGIKLGF